MNINNPSAWLRLRTACATSLLPLLLTLPAAVQAQFNYATLNGTITITGYTGPGGAVVIPETINGLPVTRIGDNVFAYSTNLISVTIPNSVTIIGGSAFRFCTSLSAITVDALNSVYSSVNGVLFNKSQTLLFQFPGGKAGSYTIPNSVTRIRDFAFYACSNLTSVTIPNSVTRIGQTAFAFCTSLSNVAILNSVTSIGSLAFANCTSLTSVTIPNSVTSIEEWAFDSCRSLTSVTIGNSVASIGHGAFLRCTSLSAITVDALNSDYCSVDGVLFNKSQTLLIEYPGGKAGSYTIPNSVTSIGNYAFYSCTSLTSVTIPNSVTSIGKAAFSSCTSLTSLTIGNGVTSIGEYAFNFCTSLTRVTIPNSLTSIGGSAFSGCTGLSNVSIGNGVTSVESYAFNSCTNLTSVTIGNGVTSIESSTFAYCTSLTGVYFQGNAPSVGMNVFAGVNNATVYYLPGTTGWGTTFAGRPTVLWNPLIESSDASFGVRTNRFGFTISETSDLVIVVEACTNLVNPAWSPVGTNTLTGGSSYFSDPEWTNHPARFYRLRSP